MILELVNKRVHIQGYSPVGKRAPISRTHTDTGLCLPYGLASSGFTYVTDAMSIQFAMLG